MKWFIVALLATRMEAFEVGTGEAAHIKCRNTLHSFEKQERVALPKRLAEMLDLDVVEALTCIDGDTVTGLMSGKWGRVPVTREDINKSLPKLLSPPPAKAQGTPDIVFRTPQPHNQSDTDTDIIYPFARYKF